MRLFVELNDNLLAYSESFQKQKLINKGISQQHVHHNGEKYTISPANAFDYRQWEQFDILEFEDQAHQPSSKPDKRAIPQEYLPSYIREDVAQQELNIKYISALKSGIKKGSKLKNSNN